MHATTSKPNPAAAAVVLGTLDERMLILVDIDKLMSSTDMGLIEQAACTV